MIKYLSRQLQELQIFLTTLPKRALAFNWISIILGNICSWLFNLLASRSLTFAGFGHLSVIVSVYMLLSVITSSLGFTVVRFWGAAYAKAPANRLEAWKAVVFIWQTTLAAAVGLSIVLFFSASLWTTWLNLPTDYGITIVTISQLIVQVPYSWFSGLLQAQQLFVWLGVANVVSGVSRLGIGWYAVNLPHPFLYLSLSLPLAIGLTSLLVGWVSYRQKWPVSIWKWIGASRLAPQLWQFYRFSLILGVGTILLSNLDILLVKHFFDAHTAGIYSVVAMIGKTLFFINLSFITLLPALMAPRLEHPHHSKQLAGILFFGVGSTFAAALGTLTLFPQILVWLVAEKALAIHPYILPYLTMILGLSLLVLIANYLIQRNRYRFSLLILLATSLEISLIWLFHHTIEQVITVMLVSVWLPVGLWSGYLVFSKIKPKLKSAPLLQRISAPRRGGVRADLPANR